MAFLLGGANSASGGYDIDNSLRFNGSNDRLTKTLGTPSNNKIWTLSWWQKLAWNTAADSEKNVFSAATGGGNGWNIDFTNNAYKIQNNGGTGADFSLFIEDPARQFRDPSAWQHFVVATDTTQGTAANRVKVYIDGVLITVFLDTETYPDADDTPDINRAVAHNIGANANNDNNYFNGYLSEIFFIDGTQYAASNFGETDEDSGIWKPKDAKGALTFGDNGFYLEFKQTGTGADANGMGADTSGEDNHFAIANLAANNVTTDTPTNNFCTLNSVDNDGVVLTEGNLTFDSSSGNNEGVRGTMGVQNGKWYYECTITGSAGMAAGNLGYSRPEVLVTSGPASVLGLFANGSSDFGLYNNSSGKTSLDASDGIDQNDVIGVALDLDNDTIAYYRESSIMGSAQTINASILGDFLLPVMLDDGGANDVVGHFNFGNPTVALDSGNADENGYGNFEHAPPSGYYALCTKNLAEYG